MPTDSHRTMSQNMMLGINVPLMLLLMTSLQTSWACYCPHGPKSSKEHWCNSNIVISGTVLTKKTEQEGHGTIPYPPIMKYAIRIDEVFKGRAERHRTLVFNTLTDSNHCGLTVLKPKRKYLLAAWDYGGGDIWISYCDWHEKRRKIRARDLAALKYGYQCYNTGKK
ncbi:metalloproteinase inhibitor 2-like [Amphiura filiformis]|uniref:metalloproteinase inhibitor 2-like n=1 Tax=Amphiura filiformis TaxID=82378 RepID=UPI003B228A31